MKKELVPGDIVYLKSWSPRFTVAVVRKDEVQVVRFDGNAIQSFCFPPECLTTEELVF